jgi:uncharacterized protein (DUF433 family)
MTSKTRAPDIYGGEDPADVPAYTIPQVAHYLGIPAGTLRSWTMGQPYPVKGGMKQFEPIINPADHRLRQLSFNNLLEAHVLSALRRQHGVHLRTIRDGVKFLQAQYPDKPHPLIDHQFYTKGINLFVRHLGRLVDLNVPNQSALESYLQIYLKRIQHDPVLALFPFTRAAAEADSPKVIMISPRIAFGRPVIAGTSIPTAAIFKRWQVGESIEEIADDFERPNPEIEEALRWESARVAPAGSPPPIPIAA